MNDPSKRIDVNLSSLLSLKAELLRKQQEVSNSRASNSIESFVPKRNIKSDKIKKSQKDKIESKSCPESEILSSEETAMLLKSRKILEQKSKFYDKMSKTGGSLNSDDNCLVMFNVKKQVERPGGSSSSSSSDENDDNVIGPFPDQQSIKPDEEWVEYVDCLGRSRKCLKKDLELFKKKDDALSAELPNRNAEEKESLSWYVDTKGTTESSTEPLDNGEINSVHIDGELKQKMKEQWEVKEKENMQKEFIHYQDVLFDEARTHGVGYYKFSTDDEERFKQQRELEKLREATLSEQKKREEQRKQREDIIKERVKAARNRQRFRQGLPPLEDNPENDKNKEELYDTTEERQKKEVEEKLKKQKERKERKREKERKKHIRPWDKPKLGKPEDESSSNDEDDKPWEYKKEREPMSQEKWNELQREKRPQEFAPVYDIPIPPPPVSKPAAFPRRNHNIQDIFEDDPLPSQSLFFTTKKPPPVQKSQVPVLIQNEVDSDEEVIGPFPAHSNNHSEDDDDDVDDERIPNRGGAEIAPPPTFDYYGPTSNKRPKMGSNIPRERLEKSIEAGLKFLRDQSDKNASSGGKRVWTTKADY